MPKYKVTVTFDRLNPKTKAIEKNSVREGVFYSSTPESAKKFYLRQFKENEPTRRKVRSVRVEETD